MISKYWLQKFSEDYMKARSSSIIDLIVYTVCRRLGNIRAISIYPAPAWAKIEHEYNVVDTTGNRSDIYSLGIEGVCTLNYFRCLRLYHSKDMRGEYYYFLVKNKTVYK